MYVDPPLVLGPTYSSRGHIHGPPPSQIFAVSGYVPACMFLGILQEMRWWLVCVSQKFQGCWRKCNLPRPTSHVLTNQKNVSYICLGYEKHMQLTFFQHLQETYMLIYIFQVHFAYPPPGQCNLHFFRSPPINMQGYKNHRRTGETPGGSAFFLEAM